MDPHPERRGYSPPSLEPDVIGALSTAGIVRAISAKRDNEAAAAWAASEPAQWAARQSARRSAQRAAWGVTSAR